MRINFLLRGGHVMVHSQGIIEALLKVYGADSLVNEIFGKK